MALWRAKWDRSSCWTLRLAWLPVPEGQVGPRQLQTRTDSEVFPKTVRYNPVLSAEISEPEYEHWNLAERKLTHRDEADRVWMQCVGVSWPHDVLTLTVTCLTIWMSVPLWLDNIAVHVVVVCCLIVCVVGPQCSFWRSSLHHHYVT
jgi:hypothetical protein